MLRAVLFSRLLRRLSCVITAVLVVCTFRCEGTVRIINGVSTNGGSSFDCWAGTNNSLIVTNAGYLVDTTAYLGSAQTNSYNTAIVTGTNSLWQNTLLYVGYSGSFNQLQLTNGGWESGSIIVGANSGAVGNSMRIDSGQMSGGNLEVRHGAVNLNSGSIDVPTLICTNSDALFNLNGGSVRTRQSSIVSNANTVTTCTGGNSTGSWDMWGTSRFIAPGGILLGAGMNSTFTASVNVATSAVFFVGPLFLGSNGVTWGTSRISVTNATFEANSITTGSNNSGTISNFGGTFQFSAAPTITNNSAGSISLSNGTIMFHDFIGADASLTAGVLSNISILGNATLCLSNSTTVPMGTQTIASNAPANFRQLLLTGANANWIGDSLVVSNGGLLTLSSQYATVAGDCTVTNGGNVVYLSGSYNLSNASSRTVVAGSNTLWSNFSPFYLCNYSVGSQFIVTNGARVLSSNAVTDFGAAILGGTPGRNNSVLVTGAGSIWDTILNSTGLAFIDLYIGGISNEFVVSTGGTMRAPIHLGVRTNDIGDVLLITGSNSLCWTGALPIVGAAGYGHQMVISNAGTLYSEGAAIGYNQGADGNAVVVTGPGSTWLSTNGGDITIGDYSSSNSLIVRDGAEVLGASCDISGAAHTSNNTLLVEGPGSFINCQYHLNVGPYGSDSSIIVRDGGHILATNLSVYTSSSPPIRGSSLYVGGPGALLEVPNSFSLSGYAPNFLTIENAATVTSSNAVINAGSVAHVRGAGTYWNTATLGVNAGASLSTEDGAWINVTQQLQIGAYFDPASSSSSVIVNGAAISVTNATADAKIIMGVNGPATLRVLDGSLAADVLQVVQPNTQVEFSRGTIFLGASTFSNGLPAVVGDGARAARLSLLGGNHTFANGLAVSPGAMLIGPASITGSVTNGGTINVSSTAVGGTLGISGSLTLTPNSRLQIKIASPGSDTVSIAGVATLNGTLSVAITGTVRPTAADTYTILQFPSAVGSFINAPDGARLRTTDGLTSFVIHYNPNNIQLTSFEITDGDGDGIDDAWAMRYFGHSPLTQAEKDADLDGDGMSNYGEFICGTDPTDPQNVLKILSATPQPDGSIAINFAFVPEKSYHVRASADLSNWSDIWDTVFSFSTNGIASWTDDRQSLSRSAQYYQISVP